MLKDELLQFSVLNFLRTVPISKVMNPFTVLQKLRLSLSIKYEFSAMLVEISGPQYSAMEPSVTYEL